MEVIREQVRKKYATAITAGQSCCGGDCSCNPVTDKPAVTLRPGTDYTLRPAKPDDLPAIESLLTANGLPTAGIAEHLSSFVIADTNGVTGLIGLELAGRSALLRSLAVSVDWRNRGLGSTLVTQALELARQEGATTVYLLTNTAERFVSRWDFTPIGRKDIPVSLLKHSALAALCPATSTCMQKNL